MKKFTITVVLILLSANTFSQTEAVTGEFNFGLEKTSLKQKLPDNWLQWGSSGSLLSIDTTNKHSGNNSILIHPSENRTKGSFGCAAYSIPANYKGTAIELKAYMKLLDVTDGTIGLMLRIDGASGNLQFDNMMQYNITGTSDWTQYSVKLPYPVNAKIIYIGAILSGKGKLWIEVRPGENRRCDEYCQVAKFCEQRKRYLEKLKSYEE